MFKKYFKLIGINVKNILYIKKLSMREYTKQIRLIPSLYNKMKSSTNVPSTKNLDHCGFDMLRVTKGIKILQNFHSIKCYYIQKIISCITKHLIS